MRPVRLAALLPAAALLAACGHPLLGAELEVPEVRITSEPRQFPAIEFVAPQDFCTAAEDCLFHEVEYDLGEEVPLLDDEGVSVDLRLTGIALHLVSTSAPWLDAVDSIRILLRQPGSGDLVVLASWTNPGAAPTEEIHVASGSGRDLGPYLDDGRIAARFEIDFDTTQPMAAFTATLEAGFSVDLAVDYLDL
jgi:hypothetical protein